MSVDQLIKIRSDDILQTHVPNIYLPTTCDEFRYKSCLEMHLNVKSTSQNLLNRLNEINDREQIPKK